MNDGHMNDGPMTDGQMNDGPINDEHITHDGPAADVPIVDLAPFFAPGATEADRAAVAGALGEACERIGFVLVTGHGVDPAVLDAFVDTASTFFRLPLERKLAVKSPVDQLFQGYACPGQGPGYHTSERQSFNVFRYDTVADAVADGYPDDIGDVLYEALWPAEPAAFRAAWRAWFEEVEALAGRILTVMEVALGLPAGWFAARLDHDPSTLVANWYSRDIDSGHEPSPFRFKAHVDGSVITILHQDDGPGALQLHQRHTGWRDVTAVPGTFVVNIGEVMERWTNDRFVATPHRVLAPPDDEWRPRLSAPFFVKPNLDAVVAPAPELVSADAPSRYEPMTGKQWLLRGQADIRGGYDSTVRFSERAALDATLA